MDGGRGLGGGAAGSVVEAEEVEVEIVVLMRVLERVWVDVDELDRHVSAEVRMGSVGATPRCHAFGLGTAGRRTRPP